LLLGDQAQTFPVVVDAGSDASAARRASAAIKQKSQYQGAASVADILAVLREPLRKSVPTEHRRPGVRATL